MSNKINSRLITLSLRLAVILLLLSGLIFAFDRLFPPNLTKLQDVSIAILDKNQQLMCAMLAKDERWRFPVKLGEVDPLFIKMLVAFEDKRFFKHKGVDFIALLRAVKQWFEAGQIVSGGSSLTMQTVRLLEPRSRTLGSKMIEIVRALQLEAHFSKSEILEFYLSLAPYGGNLEGIRAASLIYFGKEPKILTPAESALLVVLPQSPNRLRLKSNPAVTTQNRDKVLKRMEKNQVLSSTAVIEAMEDPLPSMRYTFPRLAPHLGFHLVRQKAKKIVSTTIDSALQKQIEDLLKKEIPFLQDSQSIAVMIVNNDRSEVLSYVASVDFLDEKRRGHVNMIEAIRSPGSLLKPFIYALGFDEGIIHPDTIIQDVPTGFSGYSPSNFKDLFHGAVTIREALKHSLNVPAVAVLERLGPARFYALLRSFNITLKLENKDDFPSLPLALGGVGMTLWDLMSLYTALANEGEFRPLRLLHEQEENTQDRNSQNSNSQVCNSQAYNTQSRTLKLNRICGPETARQIADILQESAAPDAFVDRSVTRGEKIAYKTGTSYGYRDAWSIGYTSQFTVGVWLGKADGSSSAPNTGRLAAAPILFKIFDILPQKAWDAALSVAKTAPAVTQVLPRHLQEFKTRASRIKQNDAHSFCISFPKEGSIINLENDPITDGAFRSLKIRVSGGNPPYFCFINGRPLSSKSSNSHAKEIQWRPESKGFVELTVLDSLGQSASSTIELR